MSEQKKDWRYWVERKKQWPPPFIPRVRVGPGSIRIVNFDEYINSPRIQAMIKDMVEMDLTGIRRRRREQEKKRLAKKPATRGVLPGIDIRADMCDNGGMSEEKKDWRYWVERKKQWPPPITPRIRITDDSIRVVNFDEVFNSPRVQAMLNDMREMDLTGKRRRRREKEKNGS